jgi:hypothetical protein
MREGDTCFLIKNVICIHANAQCKQFDWTPFLHVCKHSAKNKNSTYEALSITITSSIP